MSVRIKLLVILTFVALVPLSLFAYTTLGLHQDALRRKISEVHARSAKYGATLVEANLERAVLSLRPTIETSIDWSALSRQELEGALWLLHGQLPIIDYVALLDSSGRLQVEAHERAQGSLPPNTTLLQLLTARLDLKRVLDRQLARGSAVRVSGDSKTSELLLPVGFRVQAASGPAVLLLGISLAQACDELMRDRMEGVTVMLTEGSQRTLCEYPGTKQDRPLDRALAEQLNLGQRTSLQYVSADGTEMLAAAAATVWGFRVVVAQPQTDAFAATVRMRRESLLWLAIGAIAALGAGLFLARGITHPLSRLSRGAELVAQGDFGVRLRVDGGDELSAVTHSFNRMCGEIEARDREIRGWNEELRARVEQKTGELKDAQDALLESRKLAAMSALAAGVAHEINNPLTGVIGLTQILLSRNRKRTGTEGDAELLQSVEREALRVRDIVSKMQLLSEAREAGGYSELRPLDWVRDALSERKAALTAAEITVEEHFANDLPVMLGDHAQLVHVMCELLDNATKALRSRPRKLLRVELDTLDGELLRLRVSDEGRGIAPEHLEQVFEPFFTTKEDWQGQGLGLAVAYRIIEAHHGSIKIDSKLGEGTLVTVLLPAKRRGAHLA
jgi:two-component system, NtrC family, sensor kinase